MRILLLGNPEGMRARLFAAAAARQRPSISVKVLAWETFLTLGGPERLNDELTRADVLRLDSPGKNWAVEKALLMRGWPGMQCPEEERYYKAPAEMLVGEDHDPGRVWPVRQWYLGWSSALQEVERIHSAFALRVRIVSPPKAIQSMFDKARCHEIFAAAGVPTPSYLGLGSVDRLLTMFHSEPAGRIFLKASHGSSASAVKAMEWRRGLGVQAFTTLRVTSENGYRLYNERRVRKCVDGDELKDLSGAICGQRAVIESWFPKASFAGRVMDLRVVVINGRAEHVVLRLAKGPITNLQLGAVRGDVAALRADMGEERWERAMSVAEHAAAAFSEALHVGVDLMLSPGWNKAVVAEVNAFGDLLPNYLHRGADTYELELQALSTC